MEFNSLRQLYDYARDMDKTDDTWQQEAHNVYHNYMGKKDKVTEQWWIFVDMITNRYLKTSLSKELMKLDEDNLHNLAITMDPEVDGKLTDQMDRKAQIIEVLVEGSLEKRNCVGKKCAGESPPISINFKVGDIITLNQTTMCTETRNPPSCQNLEEVKTKMRLIEGDRDCLFKVINVRKENLHLCILGTNEYTTDATDAILEENKKIPDTILKIRKEIVETLLKNGGIKRILRINEKLPTQEGIYRSLKLPILFNIFDYILRTNEEDLTIPDMIEWLKNLDAIFTKLIPVLNPPEIKALKIENDNKLDNANTEFLEISDGKFNLSPDIPIPTIFNYIKNQQDALYTKIQKTLDSEKMRNYLRSAVLKGKRDRGISEKSHKMT